MTQEQFKRFIAKNGLNEELRLFQDQAGEKTELDDIQEKVNEVFVSHFGRTPLKERMDDILNEALELHRYSDLKSMKDEAGDLLSTTFQLCNENDWDVKELIQNTLDKIERRKNQYASLGRKYKIALLGGAFNPPTKGHIEVAQYVLNTSRQFDEVWFVPAYRHMYNKPMQQFEYRFEMCQLAAKSDGRIKVFDYEKKKNLAGETYHLLKTLLNDPEYENYHFSFIIGLDNANTFDKWVNYEELERLGSFVIVPRRGYEPIPGSWYFKYPHIFLNGQDEKIPMEICSTKIREQLTEFYSSKFPGLVEIDGLNKEVFDFIKLKQLYK